MRIHVQVLVRNLLVALISIVVPPLRYDLLLAPPSPVGMATLTSAPNPPKITLEAGFLLPVAGFGGGTRADSRSASTPPELTLDARFPLPKDGFDEGARESSLSASTPPVLTLDVGCPLPAASRLATRVVGAKARLAFLSRSLLPMIARWPRADKTAQLLGGSC